MILGTEEGEYISINIIKDKLRSAIMSNGVLLDNVDDVMRKICYVDYGTLGISDTEDDPDVDNAALCVYKTLYPDYLRSEVFVLKLTYMTSKDMHFITVSIKDGYSV